jgi:3-isopropylmalate/(R)-2-methylmalate dehydratase small subunit
MRDLIRKERTWKYGDNMDTDQIYPSKYMYIHEPAEAANHFMEGADLQFSQKVRPGDFLVAGKTLAWDL